MFLVVVDGLEERLVPDILRGYLTEEISNGETQIPLGPWQHVSGVPIPDTLY